MSISHESAVFTQLRRKAEEQLEAGATPPATCWAMGVDALLLLYRLSSNPKTAEDALKLLHELQVHQVELDLQNEEIAANERALAEDLKHYRALFEYAPLGYFVVDHTGTVIEANLAAAEIFGLAREDLGGHGIETLLTPQFRPILRALLQRAQERGDSSSCTVQRNPDTSAAMTLQFQASALPGSGYTLLTCCEGAGGG